MENYPSYIHQYLSIKKAKTLLESSKLRLSKPETFNDPFEFLPVMKYTKDIVLNNNANKSSNDILNINMNFDLKGYFIPFYDIVDDIRQRNIFNKSKRIIDNYRVGCFSETDDSILMWGHYSQQHTGVVISYSTAMDYWENNLFKVNYSNNRVKVPLFDSFKVGDKTVISEQWQRELLITKYECWSYEKEWRFLKNKENCLEDEEGSYISIDRTAIRSIILGCHISLNDRNLILNLIKDTNTIRVSQAYPDEKHFAILYHKI